MIILTAKPFVLVDRMSRLCPWLDPHLGLRAGQFFEELY
jgi:hypothetical protein